MVSIEESNTLMPVVSSLGRNLSPSDVGSSAQFRENREIQRKAANNGRKVRNLPLSIII
jgi:hypothetical protein